MTKLYVSGPMTGIAEFNFPAFRHAAAKLREAGYEVEDPSEKGVIDDWTWEDYLTYDLRKVLDCDGVATLLGYENSRGATLECYVARQLKKPVLSVNYWLATADGNARPASIPGGTVVHVCVNCLDTVDHLVRVSGYSVCETCEIEAALPANERRGRSQ